MEDFFALLFLRLVITAVVTVAIKAGVAMAHHSIAWLAALLIGSVVVFGGFVIFDSDWIN